MTTTSSGLPLDDAVTAHDPHPTAPVHDPGAVARAPRRARRHLLVRGAERWALVGLVAALALLFTFLPASADTFATAANLRILAANQTVTLLLSLAVMVPLVAGHFDFSVGATAATASVVCASLMQDHGASLPVAILAALGVGVLVGAVNGVAVAVLQMNAFVSTLAVATLLGGFIQWETGGQSISNHISPSLVTFGSADWWGVPRPVLLVAVLAVVVWYLLTHTPLGRALYAVGENPRAARLVGLDVRRHTFGAFLGAGLLAGVAGVVLTARTAGATADNGTTMLFPALAAVFLGATAIRPGRFNVWGTVFGVALVAISVSGLTLAGAADWVEPVFNGGALAVAVGVSSFLRRKAGDGRPA